MLPGAAAGTACMLLTAVARNTAGITVHLHTQRLRGCQWWKGGQQGVTASTRSFLCLLLSCLPSLPCYPTASYLLRQQRRRLRCTGAPLHSAAVRARLVCCLLLQSNVALLLGSPLLIGPLDVGPLVSCMATVSSITRRQTHSTCSSNSVQQIRGGDAACGALEEARKRGVGLPEKQQAPQDPYTSAVRPGGITGTGWILRLIRC